MAARSPSSLAAAMAAAAADDPADPPITVANPTIFIAAYAGTAP